MAVVQFEIFLSIDGMWAAESNWSFFFKVEECDLCTQHSVCNYLWGSKLACCCLLTAMNPAVMIMVPEFSPQIHTPCETAGSFDALYH